MYHQRGDRTLFHDGACCGQAQDAPVAPRRGIACIDAWPWRLFVSVGNKARYALAAIRIINGGVGLLAPAVIIKQFGENPDRSPAATYGLRLFGVRTVLIGADLITQRGKPLEHTSGQAVAIHASDTITAAMLGTSGHLRPRTAVPLTLISALNTALAVAAWLYSHNEDTS
jgi:ribosomal protein L27